MTQPFSANGQFSRLPGHCHDQQLFYFAILIPRLTMDGPCAQNFTDIAHWGSHNVHVQQKSCILLVSFLFIIYFLYVCVVFV